MRWFRRHVKHGSLLALVALAINLALSFGHVHALEGKRGDQSNRVPAAAIATSPEGGGAADHDQNRHPDDLCPICMAAATFGSGIAPALPALTVQFADTHIDRIFAPVVALASPQRPAFQSRGPPIS
jgi:hypothetical protein